MQTFKATLKQTWTIAYFGLQYIYMIYTYKYIEQLLIQGIYP